MKYVGLQSQIDTNNRKSILLLLSFPCIMLGMLWVFFALITGFSHNSGYDEYGQATFGSMKANALWLEYMPWVVGSVGIWFIIAYFANTSIIRKATGARSITRKRNPRIYNIVENLCIAGGMDMPKINVINDPQLNAFASGINKNTYTVTVTTGICDRLNDEELASVIAHELTHIRNNDTKLLIISIVFVGIIFTLLNFLADIVSHSGRSRNNKNGGMLIVFVVAIICCAIAYFFALLTRFAISRKREFMADAGGAELCGNPLALASALRKISEDPALGNIDREDVAQLFIIHPEKLSQNFLGRFSYLFSTHPDIKERIRILEQF
ncbi:MAG: M48 family metallopeptidase [Bacteroidaceae bacterium]|nr:M48 family metallopeptidase [Bacteroidaceae bacterium]